MTSERHPSWGVVCNGAYVDPDGGKRLASEKEASDFATAISANHPGCAAKVVRWAGAERPLVSGVAIVAEYLDGKPVSPEQ